MVAQRDIRHASHKEGHQNEHDHGGGGDLEGQTVTGHSRDGSEGQGFQVSDDHHDLLGHDGEEDELVDLHDVIERHGIQDEITAAGGDHEPPASDNKQKERDGDLYQT